MEKSTPMSIVLAFVQRNDQTINIVEVICNILKVCSSDVFSYQHITL